MPQCIRCGRGPLKGNSVSHSNSKTIRRQQINLQIKKVDGVRMRICTSCIRTRAKQPAAATLATA